MTDPNAIEDVHLDYYRAGARVATTASYQATVPGFEAAGLDRAAALAAIGRSVELARRARDRFAEESAVARSDLLVAGSVGPYATVLADGSEYRGDYDPGAATFRDVHAPGSRRFSPPVSTCWPSRRSRPSARRRSSWISSTS